MAIKHNIRVHELFGLILVFAGASWLGVGLYAILLAANRFVANVPLIAGNELMIFPLYFGLGAVLFVLGKIELREAKPGRRRYD